MILVTGATGLVGSHLLVELVPFHTEIIALYRSEEKQQQALSILSFYGISDALIAERIKWVKLDILDLVSLKTNFKGVKKVYHCAALVSFHKLDYSQLLLVNVQGTANVVNMCLYFGIDKLVHMSSVAALGTDKAGEIVSETSKWTSYDGKSGYAVSKIHGENEVWRGVEEGLKAIVVNPTIIFGAAPLNQSSIAIFQTVLKGQRFYTKGANAIVDARDVAQVMRKLMESDLVNERYLLVGEHASFKGIMNEISEQAGVKKPTIGVPSSILPKMTKLLENALRFIDVKPLLAYDSAKASISTVKYSNEKVKTALNFEFKGLRESVHNVLAYNNKLSKEK